jgi:uncharacterized protein
MNDLPLLDLFTKLRAAGLTLGVDDYQAVLRALQGGYGLADRVALARVCRLLWVRSPDEQQLFDHYFQQILGEPKPEITDEAEIRAILQTVTTGNPKPISLGKEIIRSIPHSSFRAFGYGLLLLGLSFGLGTMILSFVSLTVPLPSFRKPYPLPTTQLTLEKKAQLEQWKKKDDQDRLEQVKKQIEQSNLKRQINQTFSLVVGILVVGSFVTGCFWFLRAFLQRSPKPRSPLEEIANPPPAPVSPPKIAPQVLHDFNDEVAIAQALRQTAPGGRSHTVALDYLPVTQRQLKQSWRYLRQLVREGVAIELDIEATTRQIARCGLLLEPVFVPPRQNRTELLLLVDQEGSMVAFRSLAERLTETAARGGRLGKMGIFYFRNCPIGSLYHDPLHLEAEPVADVLAQLRRDRTVVLIFSDAGAARGGFNRDRVDVTADFLAQLQSQVRRVVWLNPMPQARWAGTTAAEIARSVPMFEATRQGIEGAIAGLRGKYASGLDKIELIPRNPP